MATMRIAALSAVLVAVSAGLIPEHSLLPHHAPVHHIALPPAISTFSFVSLNPHHPTSYSGFTNHGRGHHDPGYAVQFRQDGYEHPPQHPQHQIEHVEHQIPLQEHQLQELNVHAAEYSHHY